MVQFRFNLDSRPAAMIFFWEFTIKRFSGSSFNIKPAEHFFPSNKLRTKNTDK